MAEIIVSNKMSSTYSLRGSGETSLGFQVTVGKYRDSLVDFDIAVRGNAYEERLFNLFVQYGAESDLLFSVQPRINNDMMFEVFVNPHNKMSAIYELLEAPREIIELNPVRDTFVASNSPYNVLNYGANNSMKVGYDDYGRNLAYLGFDVSGLPENIIINKATLKVFYRDYQDQILNVHRNLTEWNEYSLTYNNNTELYTMLDSVMEVDEDGRFISFDITNLAIDWYKGIPNQGVTLTSDSIVTFLRSRESASPPILEVDYYSTLPYIVNSDRRFFDLIVRQQTDNGVDFSVDIKSFLMTSQLGFSVHAVNRNKINDGANNLDFDVEVNSYDDISFVDFEIKVQKDGQDEFDFSVEVNEYEDASELGFEIKVQHYDKSELGFDVEVNEYEDKFELGFELTVVKYDSDQFKFDIKVNEYDDASEFYFDIGVIDANSSALGFEVSVNEYFDNSELLFDLTVIGKGSSGLPFEILVNEHFDTNDLLFEIEAFGIYTNDDDSMIFELTVPIYDAFEERMFEIEVNPRYDSSELLFTIAVQEDGESEFDFDVYPRLFMISQADFEVEVEGKTSGKVYVYLV